jgi:hypothetical protein
VLVVVLPGEIPDATLGVVRHRAIIVLADFLDPDIENTVHRRQIT